MPEAGGGAAENQGSRKLNRRVKNISPQSSPGSQRFKPQISRINAVFILNAEFAGFLYADYFLSALCTWYELSLMRASRKLVPVSTGQACWPIVSRQKSSLVRDKRDAYCGKAPGYSYDINGNLTGDGTYTYNYDYENRLIKVSSGGSAIVGYYYTGAGRRIEKIVYKGQTTTTTQYCYGGG